MARSRPPVAASERDMPSTAASQPRSALSSRSTPGSAFRLSAGSPSRKATGFAGSDVPAPGSLHPAGLMQRSLCRSVGSELSVGAPPHWRPWVAIASPVEMSQTAASNAPRATATSRRA